jgi:hypothetical protein
MLLLFVLGFLDNVFLHKSRTFFAVNEFSSSEKVKKIVIISE